MWIRRLLVATLLSGAFALMGAEVPMRIAVFDFTSIDIEGQKFYRFQFDNELPEPLDTISDGDRRSIDDRVLGWVKMLEVQSAIADRQRQMDRKDAQEERELALREELARKMLEGDQRAVVIGAEYLTAALGAYPAVFQPVARKNLERAILEIELGRNLDEFDSEVTEFRELSGADYILYTTVTDLRTRETVFKGFGIESRSTEYSLDLLVKLVRLDTREVVFSDTCTGTYLKTQGRYTETSDDGIYQELLKNAVKTVARDMDQRFRPQADAASGADPDALVTIRINPRGIEPGDVEIYIDKKFRGNAPAELNIPAGFHRITLIHGDDSREFDVEIAGGENFSPNFRGIER